MCLENLYIGYSLERFIKAQSNKRMGNYAQILLAVNAGQKIEKELWHIFPQYTELGINPSSYFFGINEFNEAAQYLAHPILGTRLREITQVLFINKKTPINKLFTENNIGLIRSCMTLFDKISPNDIFANILNIYFKGEKCQITLNCILADTKTFSFKLLTETTDQTKTDYIVDEYFPKFGDIIVNQSIYQRLKRRDASFKAMIYNANKLNDELLCAVKDVLDRNVGNSNKIVVLASIVRSKNNFRYAAKYKLALSQLLESYNKHGCYIPFSTISNKIIGLNLVIVIAYLK